MTQMWMCNLTRRQSGMALLQVLLMSAVISVLAMQMTMSSQTQVRIAQSLLDKAKAEAELRSLESELMFALATQPWVQESTPDGDDEINELVDKWNFYGKPVSVSSTKTMIIQDDGGLISVYAGGNKQDVVQALTDMLGSDALAVEAQKTLVNMQSRSRELGDNQGQFFQSDKELQMTLSQFGNASAAGKVFTRLPYSSVRPLFSPDSVLRYRYSEQQAQSLISVRNAGELDADRYKSIVGFSDTQDITYWPSGQFRIRLEVNRGLARATKDMFIKVSPPERLPFWQIGVSG